MIEVRRNWLFYLGSAVFVMTVSALASGCRLGNNVEGGGAQQHPIDGYYQTEPYLHRMCATVYVAKPGETETNCREVSTNLISDMIADRMTNPIAFVTDERDPVLAVIARPDGQAGLPVLFDKEDFTISTDPKVGIQPLVILDDNACLSEGKIETRGKLDQSGDSTLGKYKTRGRLSMGIELTYHFTPGCEPLYAAIGHCYDDVNQCGGTSYEMNVRRQRDIYGLFYPYIEAGAMSSEQIPLVHSLSYSISYK
jgi:hypothetical protein